MPFYMSRCISEKPARNKIRQKTDMTPGVNILGGLGGCVCALSHSAENLEGEAT